MRRGGSEPREERGGRAGLQAPLPGVGARWAPSLTSAAGQEVQSATSGDLGRTRAGAGEDRELPGHPFSDASPCGRHHPPRPPGRLRVSAKSSRVPGRTPQTASLFLLGRVPGALRGRGVGGSAPGRPRVWAVPPPHTPEFSQRQGACQLPSARAARGAQSQLRLAGVRARAELLGTCVSPRSPGGSLAHGQAVWEARVTRRCSVWGEEAACRTRHTHTHDSAHTCTVHTCALTTHAHALTAHRTHGHSAPPRVHTPPRAPPPPARRRLTVPASPAVPGAGAGGEVPGAERAVRPAVAGPGEVPAARGEDRPAGRLHGPPGRPPAPQQAFPALRERAGPRPPHR